LRRVTRRNSDGSEVSYVQLAHNVWDREILATVQVPEPPVFLAIEAGNPA
jgi:hypothetical protein